MTADQQSRLATIIVPFAAMPGGLLPLLHAVQGEWGYIPSWSVGPIASALHLSRAEVHGVITFYHDLRETPPGRHRVEICRAEACQATGARQLEAKARARLGIDFGETTDDGTVTLDTVYCLGNCACAPSVRIDDALHARVDGATLDRLLSALQDDGGRA